MRGRHYPPYNYVAYLREKIANGQRILPPNTSPLISPLLRLKISFFYTLTYKISSISVVYVVFVNTVPRCYWTDSDTFSV